MATRSTRNHSLVLNSNLDANNPTHTNVVLGSGAGESLSGLEDGEITCVGFGAGKSLTTSGNVAIGTNALQAACNFGNTVVGKGAGDGCVWYAVCSVAACVDRAVGSFFGCGSEE